MDRDQILARYRATRALSLELCAPLAPEDFRIQSMPDVSPPWWNLGHTSWFFAANVLKPWGRAAAADARLDYVLNSYYESLGPRLPRAERGLVTRPTTPEVLDFRRSVDERLAELIETAPESDLPRLGFLVETGIQHEQQHQELLVTELKHILGANVPALREPYVLPPDGGTAAAPVRPVAAIEPVGFAGGLCEIGDLEGGWAWDNELPVHKAWLEDFALASRLVTNGEYLDFLADGGYRSPLLWLANGWAAVAEQGWESPLYWRRQDGEWRVWTLSGEHPLDPAEPVSHVSFYEADAYARWKGESDAAWRGARLATEREWEVGARRAGFAPAAGNFLDDRAFAPLAAPADGSGGGRAAEGVLLQTAGDLWEWTSSHYEPYPGYRPFEGALMEYNGKFMDNQRVLRGGSYATPRSHIRVSYRNFWPPATRFQATGIRLARGADR